MINKTELLEALVAKLHADLELITRAARLAHDEATNEESRAESKWDTRGQEAAYLAEGQAKLAGEIGESINLLTELDLSPTPAPSPIQVGSVFVLNQPGGEMYGFVAPRSGGTEVEHQGAVFTIITPTSPIGRAVLGKTQGENITLPARGKARSYEIIATY